MILFMLWSQRELTSTIVALILDILQFQGGKGEREEGNTETERS